MSRHWDELESYGVKIPAIDVDYIADFGCAEYVFQHGLNEEWYDPKNKSWCLLHEKTPEFLKEKGYVLTYAPKTNDLVVYLRTSFKGGMRANHFGLYRPGNRAISKWGCGNLAKHPIVEHPIEYVPDSYGPEVLIFKKLRSYIPAPSPSF